jgi:hypothetical protein
MNQVPQKPTLLPKLAKIMEAVGEVPKLGYNKAQDYWYVREEDLVKEVRKAFIAEKVLVIPHRESVEVRETQRVDKATGQVTPGQPITTVLVTYQFIDSETGDQLDVPMVGQGADSGDKGSSKALTGALKYVLRQSFLIPTGDDPEKDDGASEGGQAGHSQSNGHPRLDAPGGPPFATEGQQRMLYAVAMEKHGDKDRAILAKQQACEYANGGEGDSRKLPKSLVDTVRAILTGELIPERAPDIPVDAEGLPGFGEQADDDPAAAGVPDAEDPIPF